MRQVTAATVILAMLATTAAPLRAQDSAQGLRDAIDANTAERASSDTALDPAVDPGLDPGQFLTEEALDELVAPVALYPDALLAQVLVAATYPLQVVEAERLLKQKDDLSEAELGERLKKADWDPSVTVLASGFPTVIERMSDDLEWTEKLGDAMVNQDDDVLAAVQRKREEAKATGYLADNSAQVIEEDDSGHIAIKPADPKVVYVPTYDPEVVYTSRPTQQPYIAPVTQAQSPIANPLIAGALGFGAALLVQELFGNDDDDHDNDGWDDYWNRPKPINWDDRQFYPRPNWRARQGDANRPWGWERDRYWNPNTGRWQRNTPQARKFYDRERRDALGWVVVDDPNRGSPYVRAFRNQNNLTNADRRAALQIAQREAAKRQKAEAQVDKLQGRVQRQAAERRADAIAAQRRETRLQAAAQAARKQADQASARSTKDAKARAAADRARATADAKARAAQKAAADAKAKAQVERKARIALQERRKVLAAGGTAEAANAAARERRAAQQRWTQEALAAQERARNGATNANAKPAAESAKAKQAAADRRARQAAAAAKARQADQNRRQVDQDRARQAQDAKAKQQQAQDARAKQAAQDKARADARAKQQAQDAKAKQAADAKAKAAAADRQKQERARQQAAAQKAQAQKAQAQKAADSRARQAAADKAAAQKAAAQRQATQQKAAQQQRAAQQQKAAQQQQSQQRQQGSQQQGKKACRNGDKNCQKGGDN